MNSENNGFKSTTIKMKDDLSKLAKKEGKLIKDTGKVVSKATDKYVDELENKMKAMTTDRFKDN